MNIFRAFILTLLLSGTSHLSIAQKRIIDSLQKIVNTTTVDTTKLSALCSLSGICEPAEILSYAQPAIKLALEKQKPLKSGSLLYRTISHYLAAAYDNEAYYHYAVTGDGDKEIANYRLALNIKQAIRDSAALPATYINMGSYYQRHGDMDKGLEFLLKALDSYPKGTQSYDLAGCLTNIGSNYYQKGDINNALNYYDKALKMMETIKNFSGAGSVLHNMAAVYIETGDTTNHISSLEKSMTYFERSDDQSRIAQVLSSLGRAYSTKDLKKAIDYYQKSQKLAEKGGYKNIIADNYLGLAYIYDKQGDYQQALEYVEKSLKLKEETGSEMGQATALIRFGSTYFKMGNVAKAAEYGEKGLKMAQENGFPGPARLGAELLKNVYEKQHNYEKAFKMYNLYIQMKDSLNNKETRKAVVKQQLKHEYEKKAAADSVKVAEEQKITAVKFKQEQTQRYALYGGLLLIGLFAVFMFNRFKVTQKQKQIIEVKSKETEEQKVIIEEKQKEIVDSINYAKRIQYSLLAHEDLLKANLPEHFVFFKPKDIVSGDFYWATKKGTSFYIAVCDSTGHGVPGAFMSLLNISFLNEAINEKNIVQPNEILNHTRQRLIENMEGGKDGMDAILVRFDTSAGKTNITYAAANNEPVLVKQGAFTELPKDKMPVGKGEKNESFTLQTIEAEKGDILYLYTDGFADQFGGPKGKKFKYKTLNELLVKHAAMDMNAQSLALNENFINWKRELEQVDDVCVVGIRL